MNVYIEEYIAKWLHNQPVKVQTLAKKYPPGTPIKQTEDGPILAYVVGYSFIGNEGDLILAPPEHFNSEAQQSKAITLHTVMGDYLAESIQVRKGVHGHIVSWMNTVKCFIILLVGFLPRKLGWKR